MLAAMSERDRIRLLVDVERVESSIDGRLVAPDGVGHEFYGWTALASAIEAAIDGAAAAPDTVAAGEPGA
jgi:uncharacterized protein YfaP (DUF2135 family)